MLLEFIRSSISTETKKKLNLVAILERIYYPGPTVKAGLNMNRREMTSNDLK